MVKTKVLRLMVPLFWGIYRDKAFNRSLETTKVKLILEEAIAAAGLPAE